MGEKSDWKIREREKRKEEKSDIILMHSVITYLYANTYNHI